MDAHLWEGQNLKGVQVAKNKRTRERILKEKNTDQKGASETLINALSAAKNMWSKPRRKNIAQKFAQKLVCEIMNRNTNRNLPQKNMHNTNKMKKIFFETPKMCANIAIDHLITAQKIGFIALSIAGKKEIGSHKLYQNREREKPHKIVWIN